MPHHTERCLTNCSQKKRVGLVAIAVIAAFAFSSCSPKRTSVRQPSPPKSGTCVTDRSVIPSTTCSPTKEQVAKAFDIAVPSDAADFSSTYEQALDWQLRASFTVTREQAQRYLSLADYPGVAIDGPEAKGTGPQGEHRSLRLTGEGDRVRVEATAFTT